MRLLIVEDEHKIANSLRKGLEQEGFAVDVSYNGIDGYDLASTENYALIVLDLMLPGINGVELCSKLRESNIHIPIIMLTARAELEDRVHGLNIGADDYLTKPFAFTELLARIKALLRRPHELIPNRLICGDLQVDTETFEVKRGENNIVITKKEYSLLEYFLRHKNQTLSKEKILEHVWSYESDVLPNTLEVYIGYLRSKIDIPFKKSPALLKTVRGFGYKLVEPNV